MSRRRYRRRSGYATQDETKLKLIFGLSFATAILISFIVTIVSRKPNFILFIILAVIFLILYAALFAILSMPAVKGKIGEARVSKILKKLADVYDGHLINNVIIPGEGDKTSQIDHILVTNYGIYVIETKNYSGRIYGNDQQNEWTQVLAFGNDKNKLYNPVKQNQTHIYRLTRLISPCPEPYNIIVFPKADISHIASYYVVPIDDLEDLLENRPEIMDDQTTELIAKQIKDFKKNPIKTSKEHVQEIEEMQEDIDNNICPRCGADLVLKISRYGKQFYGCSNYPKCKFVKKIR